MSEHHDTLDEMARELPAIASYLDDTANNLLATANSGIVGGQLNRTRAEAGDCLRWAGQLTGLTKLLAARSAAARGEGEETAAEINSRFDPANEAGQEVFNAGFCQGWLRARYPDWPDDEAEAREEFNREVDGVEIGEAWDGHREMFFKRLPLLAVERPPPAQGAGAAGLPTRIRDALAYADEYGLSDNEPIGLTHLRYGDLRAILALSNPTDPAGGETTWEVETDFASVKGLKTRIEAEEYVGRFPHSGRLEIYQSTRRLVSKSEVEG